jgi:formylglycine-generating enzyme required for sulfatase activity
MASTIDNLGHSRESRLERTIAVGMYPRGATQQGVMDMAGNVLNWCLNPYDHPEAPKSLRIDESNTPRVLRGGSWSNEPEVLRVSFRGEGYASFRLGYIGFRLAQDIP